ncbi:MAG: DUF1592 domain-containing protein [Gemmatimonadetes bacterium]|nr:DUF1592 domain-containing protein [Gemmatimonadota bacterium]
MKKSVLFLLIGIFLSATAWAEGDATYKNTVRTFLAQRCYKCHGAELQKADLRFDTLTLDFHNEDVLLTWQNIADMLNLGLMPPYEEPQPELAEMMPVIDWITASLKAHYEAEESTGGQTVLRRLNRNEYRNTIRDLLHLDMTIFDPTDAFPQDDEEHGFDNIGKTLVMSDFLVEKYLDAADQIVQRAVLPGPPPEVKTHEFTFPIMRGAGGFLTPASRRLKQGYDEIFRRPDDRWGYMSIDRFRKGVSHSGMYRVRVRASAHNQQHPYDKALRTDENEPMRLGIVAASGRYGDLRQSNTSDITLAEFEMIADGKPRDYERELYLDESYVPRVTYPNGPISLYWRSILRRYHPQLYDKTDRRKLSQREDQELVHRQTEVAVMNYLGPSIRIYKVEIEGPLYDQWPPPSHTSIFGKRDPNKIKPRDILTRFATRAYRRPVKHSEIAHILQLVEQREKAGASRVQAITMGLKAILCSPNFLYLYENEGQLDDYALASKLSYFLWSSMPDEELFALAKKKRLHKPDVLRAQIDRMLKDEKAQAFVENFTERWLALYKIGEMPPDPRNFRLYYQAHLEDAIKKETHAFFQHILDKNMSIAHFIDSDFTFINRDLSLLYRIEGVEGREFRKVKLNDPKRGGLLGHASVLTATSNGIETSPVVRGVWVLENILGTPPPPPLPDIEPLEPDIRGSTTIRQQLASHREIATCNECHRHIDPIGFALENFNPIGAWRYGYGPKKPKIDASDVLSDGSKFDNLVGFKKILMQKKDQFARCLTEKMLTYATGRTLEATDRPEVDRIVNDLKTQGYGLKDLVLLVATSEPFLTK